MELYPLLIFFHVLGAVALFAALGIEAVAVPRLRRAVTTVEARTWMDVLRGAGLMGLASMVMILVAGVWMMALRWGPRPWIVIALAGLIVMAALAAVVTRPAMKRIRVSLDSGEEQLSASQRSLIASLPRSLWLRLAIGVGILGLMTVKPAASGSLAIMAVAIAVGSGAALRASRVRAASTSARAGVD